MTSSEDCNEFLFDQPWNPVSYFEEEQEATGGNDTNTAYSPSKLESLFDTNILAAEQDKVRSKQKQISESNQDNSRDTDDFNQFTYEADDGVKVLETTYELNRKAILNDFDQLRRWQESSTDPDKNSYIKETSAYSYEISTDLIKDNDIDSLESLLETLPHVDDALPGMDNCNDLFDLNCETSGKLTELESRLNETELVLPNEVSDINTVDDIQPSPVDLNIQPNECILPQNSSEHLLDLPNIPDNGIDQRKFEELDDAGEHVTDSFSSFLDLPCPTEEVKFDENIEANIEALDENLTISNEINTIDLDTEHIIQSDDTNEIDNLLDFADNIVNQNPELISMNITNMEVVDSFHDEVHSAELFKETCNIMSAIDTVDTVDMVDTVERIDTMDVAIVNTEQLTAPSDLPVETLTSERIEHLTFAAEDINVTIPITLVDTTIHADNEQLISTLQNENIETNTSVDNNSDDIRTADNMLLPNNDSHNNDQVSVLFEEDCTRNIQNAQVVDVTSVQGIDTLQCLTPDVEDETDLHIQTDVSESSEDIVATKEVPVSSYREEISTDIVRNELGDVNEQLESVEDVAVDRASEINTVEQQPIGFDACTTVENGELDELLDILEEELNVQDVASNGEDNVSNVNESTQCETEESLIPSSSLHQNAESLETENIPAVASESVTNNDADDVSEIPQPPPRSSGSIRRVRFSLDTDHEETEEPQVVPSDSSISSTPAITDEMRRLGWYAPKWIPDIEAKNCMKCDMKFTVVKRRHHCRACGRVLCSQCCNMKFHLPYMDYKPTRVCQTCCDIMVTVLNLTSNESTSQSSSQQVDGRQQPTSASLHTLPEAPPPYSESADGITERHGSTASDAPPYSPTPTSNNGARYSELPAQVLTAGQAMDIVPSNRGSSFPGSPINDIMNFQLPAYTPNARQRPNRNRSESEMSAVIMFNSTATNLPPILRRDNEETRIVNNPDLTTLFNEIKGDDADPISFIVNKNLVVRVKVVDLDCCVEKRCWCFVSDGMGASNQEEVVVLIKDGSCDIDDVTLTRKILQQMNAIFEKAKHGNPVSELEELEFDTNMLCMPKNVGMLFFKPTLQCVKKLTLPTSPYLFGLYIEEPEMPWAKNFPLRLLLRIGAEFKYYPCPLFNVLDRQPVYNGVGRTILDLLADFRNFQYSLPRVAGVTINLRGKDTTIRLPQHRYDEVMKALNSSEENVFSLAGNFSSTCDGHLVSVEKDGRYKTQTLSIVLKENRKVTCASFVVISAALKETQDGVKAKASIVEDGVMVQVTSEVMKELKKAIKDMKEYTVTAGQPSADDSSQVGIEWCAADIVERPRLLSPIDATSFDNLTNMKIRHSYDYTSNNLTAKIHWVEVYFLPQDNDTVQRLSARELGQMTSSIAKACMSALSAHLMTLIALEMARIGLRVNLAADFVEYKIGANLSTLPAELLPHLDDKLVPAIHSVMSSAQERVAVELIFQVVKIV